MTADKAPQPEHCEHECVCWLYPDNFEGACDADACGADTRSRPHTPAPASEPAFPNSTQLIKMAHTDWKNREERRGIHDENDWCAGWITGYLTPNKPSPAPTDEQCRICSDAIARAATLAAQNDIPGFLDTICFIDLVQYVQNDKEIDDISKCRGKDCNYCGKFNESLRQEETPRLTVR